MELKGHVDLRRHGDKRPQGLRSGLALLLLPADPDDVGLSVNLLIGIVGVSPLWDLDLDVVVRADALDLGAAGAHDSAVVGLLDDARDGHLVLEVVDDLVDAGGGLCDAVLCSLQGNLRRKKRAFNTDSGQDWRRW